MELVLADSLVHVQYCCGDRINGIVSETPEQYYEFADGYKRKHKIVSEIFANWSPTTIKLFLNRKEKLYLRILLGPDPNHPKNIYKSLWNRFQSNVTVSVHLTYAFGKETFSGMATFKGLSINEKTFECSGNAHSVVYGFDPSLNIIAKIVAHFPVCMISSEALPNKMILEDGLFSDVIIVAANGAEIKAHKNFLAARSPVLMATFKNEMQESMTGRLEMPDVSAPGIWAFLRYLYYGDLTGLMEDVWIAFQVLCAAHKYHVSCLEAEAATCLMERKSADFSLGQAYKIFMFARNVESLVELKAKAIEILKIKINGSESPEGFQEESSVDKTILEVIMDIVKSYPA